MLSLVHDLFPSISVPELIWSRLAVALLSQPHGISIVASCSVTGASCVLSVWCLDLIRPQLEPHSSELRLDLMEVIVRFQTYHRSDISMLVAERAALRDYLVYGNISPVHEPYSWADDWGELRSRL